MNKNIIKFIAVSLMATSLTSCIKEFDAEKGYVSQKELEEAPKAFASLVDAITSNLSGEYTYSGSIHLYSFRMTLWDRILCQPIALAQNGLQLGMQVKQKVWGQTMLCVKCLGHIITYGLRTATLL